MAKNVFKSIICLEVFGYTLTMVYALLNSLVANIF